MTIKRFLLGSALFGVLLGLAASAEAQVQYEMSGDMFTYCCTSGLRYTVPYGNYGIVPGAGYVTAIPAVPVPSIRVPQGRFGLTTAYTYVNPITTGTYVSGYTTFTGSNALATLGPGQGPGTVAYCRGFTGTGSCTAPNQGTANGLVRFKQRAGGNQFGGTLHMIGSYNGRSKYRSGVGYLLIPFSTPPTIIGKSFANQWTGTRTALYTIGGVTYGTSPGTFFFTGFSWTTGIAYAQATQVTPYNPTPWTATTTGTDSRTPLGAGNITLVTGQMGRGPGQSYASVSRVRMKLKRILPSMSPGGLAALAGLMLVVVGYASRRRL